MEIPDIDIPDIYIPNIPEPLPVQSHIDTSNIINVPGCTYQHRDIKNTGNRNLLLEDPNGVYTTCDAPFINFTPLDYNANDAITGGFVGSDTGDEGTTTPDTEIPEQPKEEDNFFIECPSPKDQRIGDFRNDKKLERVIGHKIEGKECITLYEDTNFIDQYIPTPQATTTAAGIALVAASTPLILNAVKPLVKQLIKKITTRKSKNDDEVKPDQEEQ